jgi:hypothetical protein
MSHDRDAGGLEQTVQRLDRLFFCRFFHSKLSPVGGLCLKQGRRVTPIVLPKPDLKTHGPWTRRARRHLKSLPSRTKQPKPCSHGVSRFEPYPLSVAIRDAGEIRSSPVYAGHAIKPLSKLKRFAAGACSLGQDREHRASHRWLPFDPCSYSSRQASGPPPSSNPYGRPEGMVSYRLVFSECEHKRASNGQHVRKRFFNESFRGFQEVFYGIFAGRRRACWRAQAVARWSEAQSGEPPVWCQFPDCAPPAETSLPLWRRPGWGFNRGAPRVLPPTRPAFGRPHKGEG